jgi:hypothetical protein
MQDVSDKLLQQFIDCIEARLGPAVEEAAPPAAAPAAPAVPAAVPAAAPVAEQPEPTAPVPVTPAPAPQGVPRTGGPVTREDAIDLGGTVGPALLRAYGPQLAGAAVVFVLLVWLVRRLRR